MLDAKLNEYAKRFDDNFPIMGMMGVSDEEIEKIIDECLKTGKPYDPCYEDGNVY